MKHGKRLFVLLLICFLWVGIAPNYALADTLVIRVPVTNVNFEWLSLYNNKFGTNYVEYEFLDRYFYTCTLGLNNIIKIGGAFVYPQNPGLAILDFSELDTGNKNTVEVIVYTTNPCADPVASPVGGEFASFPQSVTLTCPTPGADAKIHYTTDGSTPTASSPSVASGGAVSVRAGQTLNAISISPYYGDSGVISETYTRAPKPPSPLPKTGDGFPLYALLALLGAALGGMGWLGWRLRRQSKRA